MADEGDWAKHNHVNHVYTCIPGYQLVGPVQVERFTDVLPAVCPLVMFVGHFQSSLFSFLSFFLLFLNFSFVAEQRQPLWLSRNERTQLSHAVSPVMRSGAECMQLLWLNEKETLWHIVMGANRF